MEAADVVLALQHSLNRQHTDSELSWPEQAYVTSMLVPHGGEIHVDMDRLHSIGVRSVADLSTCSLPLHCMVCLPMTRRWLQHAASDLEPKSTLFNLAP